MKDSSGIFWAKSLCDSKSAPYVLLGIGIAVASVAWGFGAVYIGEILGKLFGEAPSTTAENEMSRLSNKQER